MHADNALILGERLAAWCGHGPVLEQDIAMTNIALDQIGRARLFYQLAARIEGQGKTEDDLAYLRTEAEFYNVILVEQPNGNFAQTVVRQFYMDAFYYYYLEKLKQSKEIELVNLAEKSLKETTYHLKWSSDWIIRLGDGTEVSHKKVQTAIDDLWMYSGELCMAADYEVDCFHQGISPDLNEVATLWKEKVSSVFTEATLAIPNSDWMQHGGKTGTHSEELGFILSNLQYLQRTYPGLAW
ncbi:MAG: phenylacetate-CoA oxygenase subunit PaaC [Bacteroidota bacterium]|nr:phenylacetate-CoA oxygenase subunit PaaC [Bacteroidota bacterium]